MYFIRESALREWCFRCACLAGFTAIYFQIWQKLGWKLRVSKTDRHTVPLVILVVIVWDAVTNALVKTCGFHISDRYAVIPPGNRPDNANMCIAMTGGYAALMFVVGAVGSIHHVVAVQLAPGVYRWCFLLDIPIAMLYNYMCRKLL